MSNCHECANFFRSPRGEAMCRLNGFYPGKPHTMPRNCRDYVRGWPPRRVTWQGTAEAARGRARLPDCVVGRASGFDPYEPGGVKSLNRGHEGTLINGSCPGCHSGGVMTNSNGEDVIPTLSRDCRSTGNQIEKNGGYILERRVLSCGEGASHSPAVLAQHGTDPHAVCFGINANGVTKTAQMPCREGCAETPAVRHQGGVLVPNVASMRYVVRRLTPTECERLMGLPDGWTLPVFAPDEITDALVAEFVEIFDTFGSIMAGYAGKNPPKPKTAAWVRKWLERVANPATCPDAPRYKACGNGWATNQPRWILLRVLAKEGIDPWNSEKGEM